MDLENIVKDRIKRKKSKSILLVVVVVGVSILLYFTIGIINELEDDILNSSSNFPIEIEDIKENDPKELITLIRASIELSLINTMGSISLTRLYIFAVFQSIVLGFLIANFISMLAPENDKILLQMIQRIKVLENNKLQI